MKKGFVIFLLFVSFVGLVCAAPTQLLYDDFSVNSIGTKWETITGVFPSAVAASSGGLAYIDSGRLRMNYQQGQHTGVRAIKGGSSIKLDNSDFNFSFNFQFLSVDQCADNLDIVLAGYDSSGNLVEYKFLELDFHKNVPQDTHDGDDNNGNPIGTGGAFAWVNQVTNGASVHYSFVNRDIHCTDFPNAGVWHSVVVKNSGGTISVYHNGALLALTQPTLSAAAEYYEVELYGFTGADNADINVDNFRLFGTEWVNEVCFPFDGAAPPGDYCSTCYFEDRNDMGPNACSGTQWRYLVYNDTASVNQRCVELGYDYGRATAVHTWADWCQYCNAGMKRYVGGVWNKLMSCTSLMTVMDGECCTTSCVKRDCAYYGNPGCGNYSDGCGGTIDCGPVIVNLFQDKNSHVQNASESGYYYPVCGPVSGCDGSNAIFYLSSLTNSHVSLSSDATYTIPVCSDYCTVRNGACQAGETVNASIYALTNSHMSRGDDSSYLFKVCCGSAPPSTTNCNYWAYIDGTKVDNSDAIPDVFYRDSEILLVSNAGANFKIYNGLAPGDSSLWHIVNTFHWGTESNPIDYFGANLMFTSALMDHSENYIEIIPVDGPKGYDIDVLTPMCGDNLSKSGNLNITFVVNNKYNVVSGNVSVEDEVYNFNTFEDGTYIEIIHPLTSPGNLQVDIQTSDTTGDFTRNLINVMIYDPTNLSTQYYVSSCISSPEQFQRFDTPEVGFDAGSTRAIKYQRVGGVDVVNDLVLGDLYFEWTFVYPIGDQGHCDGFGREFCSSNNPNGYNMTSFTKIFPTVNDNTVILTVSIPPEAKT